MKNSLSPLLLVTLTLLLSSCASMPDFMSWNSDRAACTTDPEALRAPLDIPPSLRDKITLPERGEMTLPEDVPDRRSNNQH